MSKLDKYDSTSERLDDATVEQRLEKFAKIFAGLNENGIKVDSLGVGGVNVVDESVGFKMTHGQMSWEVFRVVDVVDMIVTARNEFVEIKNKI